MPSAARSSRSKSPPVAYGNSKNSLEAHLRDIKRQVDRSTADPETVQLAGRLVSGKYDFTRDPRTKALIPVVQAWGNYYRAPDGGACAMRDAYCEIQRMWDFLVLNVRYTFDQQEVDTFKTLKETLASGAEDCFALDTKIIVRSKGTGCYELRTLGELRSTWPAYEALSYDFTNAKWVFKAITGWKHKGVREVVTSSLGNGPSFTHTPNHKVWWWDGQATYKRVVERELGDQKDERADHRRVLVATKIPALGAVDVDQSHAYLAGIYAAEGSTQPDGKLMIAQDKSDVKERIEKALVDVGASFRYTGREHSNAFHVHVGDQKGGSGASLRAWLSPGGTNSFNMGVPPDILGADEHVVRTVMEAHADGDAYRPKPGSRWDGQVNAIHATSSDRLRDELQLMAMITGEPWNTWTQFDHQGAGRSPIHRFHRYGLEQKVAERQIPELPGVGYSPMREMHPAGEQAVADISVEDTHNFVLSNGMIAHNCDGFVIAFAGLLKSVGFKVVARVISSQGGTWDHIYTLVGCPHDNPKKWIPLDPTVDGSVPGWEYPNAHARQDFIL